LGVLSPDQAAVLEALLDERLAEYGREGLPVDIVTGLEHEGLLAPEQRETARHALDERARHRPIDWASGSVLQGDVLAAFAEHCRRDLDDVEVEASDDTTLAVRWRAEVSRFELRNGFFGIERLASGTPTMLLGDIEPHLDDIVLAFLDDPGLRARLAVCDLGRLERIGTVRSSAFVYFEWFLRDEYGIKLVPTPAFTQGLIDRGVISLGMG
jgi:hypothetical protein